MERLVTGVIYKANNIPARNETGYFILNTPSYDATKIYTGEKIPFRTDATGAIIDNESRRVVPPVLGVKLIVNSSLDLPTNYSCVLLTQPPITFDFVLPNGTTPINLQTLWQSTITPQDPKYTSLLEYIDETVATATLASVSFITTTAGAGDANKIVGTSSTGKIHASFLPPVTPVNFVTSTMGAGDANKIIGTNSTGKIDASFLPPPAAPTPVSFITTTIGAGDANKIIGTTSTGKIDGSFLPAVTPTAFITTTMGVADANKIIGTNPTGKIDQSFLPPVTPVSFITTTTGAADANKIIGTTSAGKIDVSFLPPVTPVSFITTTTGAADANKIIGTNSTGKIDGSFLPPVTPTAFITTTTGAADANKIIGTTSAGKIDVSFLPAVTPTPFITITTGAADANKIIGTNSTGTIDTSFLPVVTPTPFITTTVGAADANKIVGTNSTGKIDASFLPPASTNSNASLLQLSLSTGMRMFEDMVYTTGTFSTIASGASAFVNNTNLTSRDTGNHPGIATLNTGTTATGAARIGGGNLDGMDKMLLGFGTWECETLINIPLLSTAAETFIVTAGFSDNLNFNSCTDVVTFFYNTSSIYWQLRTASNVTSSYVTTTSEVLPDTWTKLKIIINADATSASFYVNNNLVGTITTNIPKGAGRWTQYNLAIVKTVGTTARNLLCDYIDIVNIFTNPR